MEENGREESRSQASSVRRLNHGLETKGFHIVRPSHLLFNLTYPYFGSHAVIGRQSFSEK